MAHAVQSEEQTNFGGDYGAVKSLFISEERNKVGEKPLSLQNNKSSAGGGKEELVYKFRDENKAAFQQSRVACEPALFDF